MELSKHRTVSDARCSVRDLLTDRFDPVIDLELVVSALNQLDENAYQFVPNWQKLIVDFFVNQRTPITLEEQQAKRKALRRKLHNHPELPQDRPLIDQIRAKWKSIRNDLRGFDTFKVAMDSVLQPSKYAYTVATFLNAANGAPSKHASAVQGHHEDHTVELHLVVAVVNQLWDSTYEQIPDWQQYVVEYFDRDDNLEMLTDEENEQKHLAVLRLIHRLPLQPCERAWIDYIRTKWTLLSQEMDGFVAFRLQMDSILQSKNAVN